MADPRRQAEEFVRTVTAAVGPRLQSALLFGSAARGEWTEHLSDINVLVLLDDIDGAVLGLAAPAAERAMRGGVRPLLMETAEWRRAADVFAIEIADMKDAHVALHGPDPLDGLVVEKRELRLQAERELRAKLLHLHGGMLTAARDAGQLGELVLRALPSFATYLRTVLRLAGRPVPAATRAAIAEGCALSGADDAPFLRVLDARQAGAKWRVNLTDPLVDQFNNAAERIAAYTDALVEEDR